MNTSALFASMLSMFALVCLARAQPALSPAGVWEGAITLPGAPLAIQVEFERVGDAWSGRIDIPAQGLRGSRLSEVAVSAHAVGFTMPGIPGSPKFTGALAGDSNSISGEFTQGGQTFPFQLTRQDKSARSGAPLDGVRGRGLAGAWLGALRPTPLVQLRLALDVTNAAGVLSGVMISVDQGGARIPLTAIEEIDGAVRLEAPSVAGSFAGKLNADGSELAGTWKQGGGSLPLVFKRLTRLSPVRRPQEPWPPFPYDTEDVVFTNVPAGLHLAGTFTKPRGPGPHPAAVLISGSGPQDRDEAIMGHRPFLVLADHLTRQGIAVLRYDDRGIGQSAGDFAAATHTDFVGDALAAVAWLKTRPGVDPQRIGLIGHSEGGIVAPLAAVQQPADVAFLALLAGVGVPMQELLVRQGADLGRVLGIDEDRLNKTAAAQRELYARLLRAADSKDAERILREASARQVAEYTAEQREALGLSDGVLEQQVRVALSPWFRELLAYDPRPTLRQVKCPVLALNGAKDLQVAARDNLDAIRAALLSGGNTNVVAQELPGLNHLFQSCATGAIAEYGQIEETFNEAALNAISVWLRRQTGLATAD